MNVTKEKILEALKTVRESQVKEKYLSRLLGLGAADRRHLREQLDRMVKEGTLQKLRGGRFRSASADATSSSQVRRPASTTSPGHRQSRSPRTEAPQEKLSRNRFTGTLIAHRDGYGFVELEPLDRMAGPSSTSPSAAVQLQIKGDVFIPPLQMHGALDGDRVVVEIDAIKRDRRAEGRIVKVLNRKYSTVVGQFKQRGSTHLVVAQDEKFLYPVIVDRGDEGRAQDGEIVEVEITRFPTPLESPRGRVIEVLGKPGDFGIDVEIVIRKHHLPHRFPEAVLEAARAVPQEVNREELGRREDFRGLPIVTIDGETARDFDDAVYVDRLANGNYELQVHIADVSHYVTPGSALDEEALLRGTSVYFPDRAVPMLPEELSNGICSLNPHVDRLVQSCIMEINSRGEVVGRRFAQGVIRSAERMTYTNVAEILVDRDPAAMERYAPLVERFRLMEELARVFNRMRDARGSIDFDLPEPVITFDENGLMTGVLRSERNIAHRLIEEFMLIANETVARELFGRDIPSLYRIHELPDPTRVAEFEIIARSFGYSLGIDLIVKRLTVEKAARERARRGKHPRSESRGRATGFDRSNVWLQPTDLQISPKNYQQLVEKIEGKPEERILSYLMLRSLKQARYSEQNLGHFGLASECYTHFTSPIRRYPDLMVHRILKNLLVHSPKTSPAPMYSQEQLAVIGEESSRSERAADAAERELVDWKKAKFMEGHVGDEFEALIVGVNKDGFYVELLEWFIEGFVPVASLFDDFYVYREIQQSLVGDHTKNRFRLGDRIRVIVDRVDEQLHKVQFLVAEMVPRSPSRRGRRRR